MAEAGGRGSGVTIRLTVMRVRAGVPYYDVVMLSIPIACGYAVVFGR
jgi:hypothetical protein